MHQVGSSVSRPTLGLGYQWCGCQKICVLPGEGYSWPEPAARIDATAWTSGSTAQTSGATTSTCRRVALSEAVFMMTTGSGQGRVYGHMAHAWAHAWPHRAHTWLHRARCVR